jgi:hypothetical protein
LQVGVDRGDALANQAVVAARLSPEEIDQQHHHRQHRQRHQRELEVDRQHDADDADQRDQVHDHRDRTGGEHLVDDVDVGGHARDQAADGVVVEVRRFHPQNFAEHGDAEIGERLLRDQHREPVLPVQERELADDGEAVEQRPVAEPVDLADRDVVVDDALDDVGLREQAGGDDGQQRHRQEEGAPVGTNELPQPGDDLQIARGAELALGAGSAARAAALHGGCAVHLTLPALPTWPRALR